MGRYSYYFFLVFFGYCLSKTFGFYDPTFLLLFSTLFALFILDLRGNTNPFSARASAAVAVVFALRMAARPASGVATSLLETALILNILFALFLLYKPENRSAQILAHLTLCATYFITLRAFPNPPIDVFKSNTLAADYVIKLTNPYTKQYPDIYSGTFHYEPGFLYWPGLLLFIVPARLLFGDIRYAFALSILGTALTFRRNKWFSYLWLSFPVGLFVLQQAWVDPALCFCLGLSIYAWLNERWTIFGVSLGLLAATKQYGFAVPLFLLTSLFFMRKFSELRRALPWTVAVFAILIVPFLIMSPRAFLDMTLLSHIDAAPRLDAFSLQALALNKWNLRLGLLPLAAVASSLAVGTLFIVRKPSLKSALDSLILFYGTAFLTGKFGFCNYYYFLFSLVLWRVYLEDFEASPQNEKRA